MLNKEQKQNQIKESVENIKKSGSLLLVDFAKVTMAEIHKLRKLLMECGVVMRVLKKRLLKIAFEEAGINYDPTQFNAQTGVLFIPKDVLSVAGIVDKFSKEMSKKEKVFVVLGGYDVFENKEVNVAEFAILAKLPSREILLAQLASVFAMPMKKLAYALSIVNESRQ